MREPETTEGGERPTDRCTGRNRQKLTGGRYTDSQNDRCTDKRWVHRQSSWQRARHPDFYMIHAHTRCSGTTTTHTIPLQPILHPFAMASSQQHAGRACSTTVSTARWSGSS
eukprot:6175927-Pleurochrysis_carterae.AAC.2